MLWRIAAVLAGLAVVGAATHANVLHAGGYGTSDAYLIMTVAALLAIGMGYAVIAWKDGHKAGAIMLGFCLVAGEVYWLATNAEREIATREADAAPLRGELAKRAKAEQRVNDAKSALATVGATAQSRIDAALTAKTAADTAAVSEAAKPGCRANCAKLLMDAKDRAERELRDARAALASATAKAEQEAKDALALLDALPAAPSAAPLPERLGLASWAWDLIMAGLRSLAVVGGSIAVALALHPRATAVQQQADAPRAPVARPVVADIQRPQSKALRLAPPAAEQEHVAAFLRAVLKPDPEGSASLRRLYGQYPEWCEARNLEPLPPAELGKHLRTIVDAIGLEVRPEGRDMVVRGAAIAA